jgi:hypothetical protein
MSKRFFRVGTMLMVGMVLGQAAALAQTEASLSSHPKVQQSADVPSNVSAEAAATAGSAQRGTGCQSAQEGSVPPVEAQAAKTDAKATRKSKRQRFSAWLRGTDEVANTPASQEDLIKAADDYNKHRQWIDDYPIEEFIIAPGGGR